MFCPQCGEETLKGARFCGECGALLDAAGEADATGLASWTEKGGSASSAPSASRHGSRLSTSSDVVSGRGNAVGAGGPASVSEQASSQKPSGHVSQRQGAHQQSERQRDASQPVTARRGCFGSGWDDVKNSKDCKKLVALMALVNMVPILRWVNIGYGWNWSKGLLSGEKSDLPKSIVNGENFKIGFFVTVISWLMLLILGFEGAVLGLVPVLGIVAAVALDVFAAMFADLAYISVAYRNRMGAAFEVSKLFEGFKRNLGTLFCASVVPTLVATGVGLAIGLVFSLAAGLIAGVDVASIVMSGTRSSRYASAIPSNLVFALGGSIVVIAFLGLVAWYAELTVAQFCVLVKQRAIAHYIVRNVPEWCDVEVAHEATASQDAIADARNDKEAPETLRSEGGYAQSNGISHAGPTAKTEGKTSRSVQLTQPAEMTQSTRSAETRRPTRSAEAPTSVPFAPSHAKSTGLSGEETAAPKVSGSDDSRKPDSTKENVVKNSDAGGDKVSRADEYAIEEYEETSVLPEYGYEETSVLPEYGDEYDETTVNPELKVDYDYASLELKPKHGRAPIDARESGRSSEAKPESRPATQSEMQPEPIPDSHRTTAPEKAVISSADQEVQREPTVGAISDSDSGRMAEPSRLQATRTQAASPSPASVQQNRSTGDHAANPARVGNGPITLRLTRMNGDTCKLSQFPVAIGSGSSMDLIIEDNPAVSRTHARVLRDGDVFAIEDMGSTNKTYIGDYELPPYTPTIVSDGDTLRLANEMLRVNIVDW